MWLLNPGGSKQEADGKVLIIPAILSLKDDVIISLHHTHSQYLRSHVWLFLISRSKGQLSRLYEDVLPAALRFPSYYKRNKSMSKDHAALSMLTGGVAHRPHKEK